MIAECNSYWQNITTLVLAEYDLYWQNMIILAEFNFYWQNITSTGRI